MNLQTPTRRLSDISPVSMDAAERRAILIGEHKVAGLTVKPARCGEVDWSAFWANQPKAIASLALLVRRDA